MVPRRKTRVVPPPPVCPLTTCMRVLGGAWTPNVVWYLRETPRRFSELKNDLSGVSAKTLSARLRKLERDGVVHREVKPTSPPTVEGPTDVARRTVDSGDRGDRGRRPRVEAAEGRALGAWVGRPYRPRRALDAPRLARVANLHRTP